MSMEYYCGLKSQRAADQIKQRNRVLKSYFSLDPMLWLQDRVHKWLVEYLYHRSTIESSLSNTHTYTHTHRATRSHNKTDKKAGWSNHFLICAENHACGACAVVSFSSRLKPFPLFFLFQNWFWFILRQNQARVCVYILFHVNLSKYLLINTYVHAEALSCLCTFSSQWHALHLHVNSPTVCKNVFLKLYCIVLYSSSSLSHASTFEQARWEEINGRTSSIAAAISLFSSLSLFFLLFPLKKYIARLTSSDVFINLFCYLELAQSSQ